MGKKQFGNTLCVRLQKGDEICAAIAKIAKEENIKVGSITGIGATDNVTIGVFDTAKKEYDKITKSGSFEILALNGSITSMNGEPYVHLHITCSEGECHTFGGHLFEGRISLTGEIFITVVDGEIEREYSEEVGINLWKI